MSSTKNSDSMPGQGTEPIAIIGIGCRLPGGAVDASTLWQVLRDPRDYMSRIPRARFDVDNFYDADGTRPGRTNAQHAYMLDLDAKSHDDPVRRFDAAFFRMQPHEAAAVDPQHRLLLEVVCESLCSAGLDWDGGLRGSDTAVYVGCMTNDFAHIVYHDLDAIPTYAATGAAPSILSNRVSYFFDWHGPSMTIDTACSSSLVAVHLAVQQLRSGQSKVAIAAGANLILGPLNFIVEGKLAMLSPTGRCRMWDAAADGYVRGEGIASVVLKTLSQALADGDCIEAIIRETGVNQDGKTPGITVPNHKAQEALIRETYARAGLDVLSPSDRCQYFEAHGTGTPAGDPPEAEAISTVFFGENEHHREVNDIKRENGPLYVGSLKTVFGHTEGAAGLAGLLKATLAVSRATIPPNMHFEVLNPRVAPFYKHVRIVSGQSQPWPVLPPNVPRRASVNSFGFGGTNAHAVVEAYHGSCEAGSNHSRHMEGTPSSALSLVPLVVSANCERSLKGAMEDVLAYIETNPGIEIRDLIWTLWEKRSILPVRRALAARTLLAARLALERELGRADEGKKSAMLASHQGVPEGERHSILGIFTGQGAQWPAMGRMLITTVPFARAVIMQLDTSLSTLPSRYRPAWTLMEKLSAGREDTFSDVQQANFAQPLCCAVQILLVRLLEAAGITFKAVVGHSSGEIGCAYAAGFITAEQAIRVAYLRGLVSGSVVGKTRGAMLAVGTSHEDAQELCDLEMFDGRLCVACHNSDDSVTLSGDADAIRRARDILTDEAKFARMLRVDKAYHSHHMIPCAAPYQEALFASECAASSAVQVGSAQPSSVVWISSVYPAKHMAKEDVTPEYWKDNLLSPVCFSEAVRALVTQQAPFHLAVEVGPHPAMKGPCLSTIERCTTGSVRLPYTGCMQRGADDVDAFATALGYIWECLGSGHAIGLRRLCRTLEPGLPLPRSLARELPTYSWDHSHLWDFESRTTSALLRGTGTPPHPLLGRLSVDSTPMNVRWHNVVRLRDMEWLEGHQLQGQVVFPASGYLVMAMEAAVEAVYAAGHVDGEVRLVQVLDVEIVKAVSFDDEDSLVELDLVLNVQQLDAASMTADFCIDSCRAKDKALSPSARGRVVVSITSSQFDRPGRCALPSAGPEPPCMNKVVIEDFYTALGALGYGYSHHFRCMTALKRAHGKACGTFALQRPVLRAGQLRPLLLHPASLDVALQTVFGALSAPGDRRLRSLYVPVRLDRIALDLAVAQQACESLHEVGFISSESCVGSDPGSLGGHVDVFDPQDRSRTILQLEGLLLRPASRLTASDDHCMFSRWVWGQLMPDKVLRDEDRRASTQEHEYVHLMERVAYFYMRTFLLNLDPRDRDSADPPHQAYINWCEYQLGRARDGRNPWYDPAWETDTHHNIAQLVQRAKESGDYPDMPLLERVGEHQMDMFLDTRSPFDVMNHDGLLTDFYSRSLSFGPVYQYLQEIVGHIAHRYQDMDILEIGGGTGGATRYILGMEQLAFNSYTFTDVSTSFFEKAQDEFSRHEDRMQFRALDISRNPAEQGFKNQSYDLVIASNVLHATPRLRETLLNTKALLRPGGHLACIEITSSEQSRFGMISGLFRDWWAGVDEGRVLFPLIATDEWDALLKATGFSGIDSRSPDRDSLVYVNSTFSTHAVDERIQRLWEPLNPPDLVPGGAAQNHINGSVSPHEELPPLMVVGGDSSRSTKVLNGLRLLLPRRTFRIIQRIQDVADAHIEPKSSFLILSELEEEFFSGLDGERLASVKIMLCKASNLLWLTEDAWGLHPEQAMVVGFLRTIRLEYPQVKIQVLDVDDVEKLDVKCLAEALLRLEECSGWHQDDGVLWTAEPELYVSRGRVLIPRLKYDVARNNRLNSSRRPIVADVDPDRHRVALCRDKTSKDKQPHTVLEICDDYSARPAPLWSSSAAAPPSSCLVQIRVRYSLAKAIRIGHSGYWYLVQGIVQGLEPERVVVALSDRNASLVDVNRSQIVPLPHPDSSRSSSPDSLTCIAAHLVAQTLFWDAAPGTSVLIIDPPQFVIQEIVHRATELGVTAKLAFTPAQSHVLDGAEVQLCPQAVLLHENAPSRAIEAIMPPDLCAVYDFSESRGPGSIGDRLAACIPPSCMLYRREYALGDAAAPVLSSPSAPLDRAVKYATWKTVGINGIRYPITPDVDVHAASRIACTSQEGRKQDHVSTIVDWAANRRLSARVRPISSSRDLFAGDRTFLLVGLTGDLGRSICRFMVDHGARHVVLCSRRPNVDPRWICDVQERLVDGGTVRVLAMDITSESSVDEGLARVRGEWAMPALGGVAFGPLVLHDVLFDNMDHAMMEAVLAPKVVGMRILHERLRSVDLDFFVVFGSFVMVIGNAGQSAYGAACAYCHAMVLQRRRLGLAASTIDIGAVIGVGYVGRMNRPVGAGGTEYHTVAEQELHALFAEAVVSGRPGSPQVDSYLNGAGPGAIDEWEDVELVTGISALDPAERDKIAFFDDPRLGFYKLPRGKAKTAVVAIGSTESVNKRLLEAAELGEVEQIITDGLLQKLRVALHVASEDNISATTPLVQQGIDSLSAVSIRTWFSKTLRLDVSVLKILSGVSVAELARETAERLPSAAIPLVVRANVESTNDGSQPKESSMLH